MAGVDSVAMLPGEMMRDRSPSEEGGGDYAVSRAARSATRNVRRVTVQDLEGDCRNTVMMLVPNDLAEMGMEVGRRFGYKSDRCRLFTRYGAPLDHLFLIKDDELLFATDGGDFPSSMKEGQLPGLDQVAQSRRPVIERFDIWGWPRVGQIIGAQNVTTKLLTSWRTSGSCSGVLVFLNFIAFNFPPSAPGRGICSDLDESWQELDPLLMRLYFWFFSLGILTSMLSLCLATTLSMQLNLLPTNRDVFWFLKEYGNWLVGWPTTFLVMGIACTGGGVLVSGLMLYPSKRDGWILLSIVVTFSFLLWTLLLVMSTRAWRRVNMMDIRKVWPGDPWQEDFANSTLELRPPTRGESFATDLHNGHMGSPTVSLADDKSSAANSGAPHHGLKS